MPYKPRQGPANTKSAFADGEGTLDAVDGNQSCRVSDNSSVVVSCTDGLAAVGFVQRTP